MAPTACGGTGDASESTADPNAPDPDEMGACVWSRATREQYECDQTTRSACHCGQADLLGLKSFHAGQGCAAAGYPYSCEDCPAGICSTTNLSNPECDDSIPAEGGWDSGGEFCAGGDTTDGDNDDSLGGDDSIGEGDGADDDGISGGGSGDCRVQLAGTDTSYAEREDVYVLTDPPAGLTLDGAFAPNSGSCEALPSCGNLNIAPSTPAWSASHPGEAGLEWGFESDENCNPTISRPGNGAAFDMYQLWFRLPSGGSNDFAGVHLQKGVAFVGDGTSEVCEIWVPSYDAGINFVFRVSGTACG